MKNTVWDGKISVDHMWKSLKQRYPDEFCPKTTSTVEDIRANWTTFNNLNEWFTHNKKPLINTGMFLDKKMILPNGGISELTYSESVARRVISMDETNHPFSTEVDKGGSRSISFGCNTDGRKSRRGTRGCRHTTGVYAINAGGETLPPLYIFDSSAQHNCNYQIQRGWCESLPKV